MWKIREIGTRAAFGVLLLTLLVVSIMSPIAHAQQPKILVAAIPGDPGTLNAAITTALTDHTVTGQIYRALVRLVREPFLKPVPDLAESWTISPDMKIFTFKLRDNILWHDGVKLTSADVKFTFEEVLAKSHPVMRSHLRNLERVDTPDERTVTFVFKVPSPALMAFMSTYGSSIIAKHIYQGTDPLKNPANTKPVGNGPYVFKEWAKGDRIVLEKNPNYHLKGLPYYDRIVFKIIPTALGRIAALEAGEIDYIPYFGVPLEEVPRLKRNPNIQVTEPGQGGEAGGGQKWVFINLRKEPLSNEKVRQAIAHAINRDVISDLATQGLLKPAYSIINVVIKWATLPNAKEVIPAYDPKKAEQLLDEAGYKRGAGGTRFTLSLIVHAVQAWSVKTGEIIKDQLKQVGIEVKLETMEDASAFDRVFNKWDFELYILFALGTGPDPSINERFFHSKNIKQALFQNAMGYNNPRVDELQDKALVEPDQEKRKQMYHEFQQIILKQLPVIPIIDAWAFAGWKKGLVNLSEEWFAWAGPRDGLDFARHKDWEPVARWEREVGILPPLTPTPSPTPTQVVTTVTTTLTVATTFTTTVATTATVTSTVTAKPTETGVTGVDLTTLSAIVVISVVIAFAAGALIFRRRAKT